MDGHFLQKQFENILDMKVLTFSSSIQWSKKKERKLTVWKVQKKFSLFRGVNSLSHYYRENLTYKSRAVNFLFLSTVYYLYDFLKY